MMQERLYLIGTFILKGHGAFAVYSTRRPESPAAAAAECSAVLNATRADENGREQPFGVGFQLDWNGAWALHHGYRLAAVGATPAPAVVVHPAAPQE
jgi:hypothetical protein